MARSPRASEKRPGLRMLKKEGRARVYICNSHWRLDNIGNIWLIFEYISRRRYQKMPSIMRMHCLFRNAKHIRASSHFLEAGQNSYEPCPNILENRF